MSLEQIYVKDEENNDELVIYDGIYASPIYIYEADGYDEYFTERYAKLLKDNLYIDISYISNNGNIIKESHKLETTLEFANNKLLELKESSKENLNVSDSVSSFRKRNETEEKLLANGFKLCAEDDNLEEDCFVKNVDDVEIMVHVSNNLFVNIYANNLFLYYNGVTDQIRFMDDKDLIYNGLYELSKLNKMKDKSQLNLIELLVNSLDLLNY